MVSKVMRRGELVLFAVFALLSGLARPAEAQDCGPQWLAGEGMPGTIPSLNSVTSWDPDGDGPRTPVLVVISGSTFNAQGVEINRVGTYDPATGVWSQLGAPLNGIPGEAFVGKNGELFLSGEFTSDGVSTLNRIARWDGTAWRPLGAGLTWNARGGFVLPNGELIISGSFTTVGSPQVTSFAKWTGSEWIQLSNAAGANSFRPQLLAGNSLENLYALGELIAPNNSSLGQAVAKWNGSSWDVLSNIGFDTTVNAIAALPSGEVVIGGFFSSVQGVQVNSVAIWNGSSWAPMQSGAFGTVIGLRTLRNGDVVAYGSFQNVGGITARGIARWSNGAWSPMGEVLSSVQGLSSILSVAELPDGDIVAVGPFVVAGNVGVLGMARWNGSTWSAFGPGFNNTVQSLVTLPNGNLVAAGTFNQAGNAFASGIAQFNGSTWSPMGAGLNGDVYAMLVLPNGDLVAGGSFTRSGTTVVNRIARWNGTSWLPYGSGMNSDVRALALTPSGDLIAGGAFTSAGGLTVYRIARWNGTAWRTYPPNTGISSSALSTNTVVYDMEFLSNGDFVVCGQFISTALQTPVFVNGIARWNGSAWSSFAGGFPTGGPTIVRALAELPDNRIVIGGNIVITPQVFLPTAIWNGSSWLSSGLPNSGMGNSSSFVETIFKRADGTLLLCGSFDLIDGASARGLARWNGTQWVPFVSIGVRGTAGTRVTSAAELPNGELAIGGSFTTAGDVNSPFFARHSMTGAPSVSVHPEPVVCSESQIVTLFALPSNGYKNTSVQWFRNGMPIIDGQAGAAIGGGFVNNASEQLASPTRVSVSTLTITNARPADSGQYTAVFSNACGSATTRAALVTVASVRCSPADIADDQGNPLPAPPTVPNTGISEGDYCAFFSAEGFFNQAALGPAAVGMFCDIADDQGTAFPPFGTGGSGGASNSGVNEGDYNCFFNNLFIPCP